MILPPKRWFSIAARALVPILALTMTGCSVAALEPTPTASPEPPTATPTIDWFPATNTPTTFPSPSPSQTIEPIPGVGEMLFADDFSEPDLWNISTSASASAQAANNSLTLALKSGPLSIASLRSGPVLGDFYAEVTASTSLCRGNDQYGVLLRASPGGTYYRFLLACNGSMRLERVRSGAVDILQNWTPSGDIPPGAPAAVRIGLWVRGNEMRFLLNERLQFILRDPVLHSGTLGFYAYASSSTPVSVSFSDLEVYALEYIPPTATPAASTPSP